MKLYFMFQWTLEKKYTINKNKIMDVIILLIIGMAYICPIVGIMLHIYALIEKKWNKNYKQILFFSWQTYYWNILLQIMWLLLD